MVPCRRSRPASLGGGGGAGYFGGGGGAASTLLGTVLSAGGSGGSSYGPQGSTFAAASGGPFVTITPENAAVRPSRKAVNFLGLQPLHKGSRAKNVKITNTARFPMQIARTFIGKNRRDVYVAFDGCAGKTIAPNASCTLWLSFAPRAHGRRAATLKITRRGRLLARVQLTGTS